MEPGTWADEEYLGKVGVAGETADGFCDEVTWTSGDQILCAVEELVHISF
jgi:hypothetical protein